MLLLKSEFSHSRSPPSTLLKYLHLNQQRAPCKKITNGTTSKGNARATTGGKPPTKLIISHSRRALLRYITVAVFWLSASSTVRTPAFLRCSTNWRSKRRNNIRSQIASGSKWFSIATTSFAKKKRWSSSINSSRFKSSSFKTTPHMQRATPRIAGPRSPCPQWADPETDRGGQVFPAHNSDYSPLWLPALL